MDSKIAKSKNSLYPISDIHGFPKVPNYEPKLREKSTTATSERSVGIQLRVVGTQWSFFKQIVGEDSGPVLVST